LSPSRAKNAFNFGNGPKGDVKNVIEGIFTPNTGDSKSFSFSGPSGEQ